MPSLNEIRKKIKTIQATAKITNAMKLVAAAKLKKQKDLFASANDFYSNFYDFFSHLKINQDDFYRNLKKEMTSQKTLWIVICSSMGLCGSFNINIIKNLQENLLENDEIILIGKKGVPLIKNYNIIQKMRLFLDIDDKDISYDLCYILSLKIWEDFQKEKDLINVKIIYTKYINSLLFNPYVFTLIPIDPKITSRIQKPLSGGIYEYDLRAEKLIELIFPNYLANCIYGGIIESKVSENASRRNSMDSATKNANNILDDYRLEFNRIRQANITNEITEIISGNNNEIGT